MLSDPCGLQYTLNGCEVLPSHIQREMASLAVKCTCAQPGWVATPGTDLNPAYPLAYPLAYPDCLP